MLNNREIYDSVEFEFWAKRADIDPIEAFLFGNFLDAGARTVEAGTGGGRLLLALGELGFKNLYGFDFVPKLVQAARDRDANHRLKLSAQDATRLGYDDGSFDQIIYLQQVICVIENVHSRRQAISEAYRILRPGGIALFSFLSHEVRSKTIPYRLFSAFLQTQRWVRGAGRSRQVWPWLRLGGVFNRRALYDDGPYVYWYRADEAASELQSAGFKIQGIGSRLQIAQGKLCKNGDELMQQPKEGGLYCVCSK